MNLQDTAERALAALRRQGFDHAQVGVALTTHSEVTAAHNQPSLLRSTETLKLTLLGLVDGRKASTELGDAGEDSLAEAVSALWASAAAAMIRSGALRTTGVPCAAEISASIDAPSTMMPSGAPRVASHDGKRDSSG